MSCQTGRVVCFEGQRAKTCIVDRENFLSFLAGKQNNKLPTNRSARGEGGGQVRWPAENLPKIAVKCATGCNLSLLER